MTKTPADLRSLACAHTKLSVPTLTGIARNSTSDQERVAAANVLLDRGWGKPASTVTGSDGGDIRIVIRQLVSNEEEPLLIEHEHLGK